VTRILLVGRDGQVGTELQRTLAPLGEVTAVDRDTCDLTRPEQVRQTVRVVAPQLIINVAAHTAVDQAESEPALAFALNADGPGLLAEEARRCGAALVHYSTDYVFDGRKGEPYVESDPVNPLGVYGRSKLAGERAITATGVPHMILRTSWVYGLHGRNFLLTMMRLAREKPELRVVADQFGVPNWSATLAGATAEIVRKATALGDPVGVLGERGGVYHLSCSGRTSWHRFAVAIVDRLADLGVTPRLPVVPIKTEEFPTPAKRPVDSVLDTGRLKRDWGISLPQWEIALMSCLQEIGRLDDRSARPVVS
jgi:dTDP-4-dehydrorhamnose reductase